ncbi:MAG: NADH-quinone oxidoreductase subunit F, partial [Vallitaleaceae bacterium]|nr:NADH-quinone oxidoreductase subunit F [Vallitaleaceae bacterium]
SKLVGRGGAGFPAGLKMRLVAEKESDKKYIVCNADEGEPGTFKDRELLEKNPLKVIESIIIAAYLIGADTGYLYVRGEYDNLKENIMLLIDDCRDKGYLGLGIGDSDFNFDLLYRSGTGAYICGEETALIESIEGRAGDPRMKPPYTAEEGLWGKPTLINNVETLVNLIPIITLGAASYREYGTEESTGTKLFSVSGAVKKRGVYEVPFGITLRELIYDYCDGMKNDGEIKFVQVGGSSGAIIPASNLDIELSYEAFRENHVTLGSGAVIVADESICSLDYLKSTAAFFVHESCGKCTPCREGNRHVVRILDHLSHGIGKEEDIDTLLRTCQVMREASFCGLGQTATTSIVSMLDHFKEEIVTHIDHRCLTGVCDFEEGGGLHD